MKVINSLFHKNLLIITTVLLFILLLPLSLKIDFPQNDDWVYYGMVKGFLLGNFQLDPLSAPTFYLQGILGALFSLILGINSLPILTLTLSVLNFLVFSYILKTYFVKSTGISIILGLSLFLNPLHIYSTWGFMTENYFLFFFLISLLAFFSQQGKEHINYVALYLPIFGAFLIRQVVFILPISYALYYLAKRDIKNGIKNLVAFILLYGFYLFVFPKTPEMAEKPLQFQYLLDYKYVFSLIWGSLIVITSYLLPLVITTISQNIRELLSQKYKILLLILACFITFYGTSRLFEPAKLAFGEYPYFENVVERTGFYPRGVHGTKYQFRGNYDFYKYLDLFSKIALILFILSTLLTRKKTIHIGSITLMSYLGLMCITHTFYDRYLLITIPGAIFFLVSLTRFNKTNTLLQVPGLLILAYLMYAFSIDFILSNSYIWHKSEILAQNTALDNKYIMGTNAWKLINRNQSRDYKYIFSYDSPDINTKFKEKYTLVENKKIDFPFNFYLKPNIYLYTLK